MGIRRPTMQGRAGFDPYGYGAGVSAPFGYSPNYRGGKVHHNGEDNFWLKKASADRFGISTEQSKHVYAVVDGPMHHIDDTELGVGVWQQVDANHRAYSWHLRDRQPAGNYTTDTTVGRMGSTGTAGGEDEHLHFEVRRAPYRKADRVNPAPFFNDTLAPSGDGGAPIDPLEGKRMYSINTLSPANSGIELLGLVGGRRMRIANTYHLGLLRRARLDDPSILPGELDIVQGYIAAVNAPVAADNAEALQKLHAILTAIQQIDTDDDTPTTVDTAPLLAAIAGLSPLIEAVPQSVVDELKSRL